MSETHGVAGFVLAGGQSRRMGRDKALLPDAAGTLVERVASEVGKVCDSVALLGDPARYGHLNLPVIADLIPGRGPMSGLHAALKSAGTDWILIVACDMPNVQAAFLQKLIAHANPGVLCVAADSADGLEPLCALYHRNTLPEVETALYGGRLRMRDLVAKLEATRVKAGRTLVRNVNTEEDWQLHVSENERLP